MSDYTELVQRLRDSQHNNIIAGWEGDARDDREAADAITKLSAERDYAMEMVNVQDNKIDALRHDIKRHVAIAEEQAQTIDALRALLREARAALPDMRHNELLRAKLDAALKDKP